jgi:hypothetical protein
MSVRCHLGYPTRSQPGNFLTHAPMAADPC